MADPVTATVALAPIVAIVKPYVTVAVGGVFSALGVFLTPILKKYLGQAIVDSLEAKLLAMAESEANAAVAAAEDNLAKQSITVSSQIVVDAAQRLEAALPPLLKKLGWTPDRLKTLVAGEIGKLQVKMTAAPAAPAALMSAPVTPAVPTLRAPSAH